LKICLHHGNIFDVQDADTIALPIDGLEPGLEGRIAHQLLKRIGEPSLDAIYDRPAQYPFNGRAHWSSLKGFDQVHFQWLCALGTGIRSSSGIGFDATPRPNQKQLARSALSHMFAQGNAGHLGRRIACPLLSGGGRISSIDAAYLLLDVAGHERSDIELHIAENRQDVYEMIRPILG
tara:strand:- start:525 stop:1058 length:534 start_codon:yes stop_codon:yes gene_type:complete